MEDDKKLGQGNPDASVDQGVPSVPVKAVGPSADGTGPTEKAATDDSRVAEGPVEASVGGDATTDTTSGSSNTTGSTAVSTGASGSNGPGNSGADGGASRGSGSSGGGGGGGGGGGLAPGGGDEGGGSKPGWNRLEDLKKQTEPTDAAKDLPQSRVTAVPQFRELAGVDLCKRLIWAISVVVLIVLLASGYAEYRNSRRAEDAEARVVNSIAALRPNPVTPGRIGLSLESLERLKAFAATKKPPQDPVSTQADLRVLTKLLSDLAALEVDSEDKVEWQVKRDSLARAQKNVEEIQKLTETEFASLSSALKAKQATLPAEGLDHQRLSGAVALMKELEAARESERKHVVGMTQLILVNVLLPLLTAMFGYIFGTGQAAQSANSASNASNADEGRKK